MTARVPFAERGGPVRGVLDLASGCYPAFLFGGRVGDQLPVFHFHDVTREWLEPRLQFLVDNGYRTVRCDEIAHLVIDGVRLGRRAVALTFDDAWASAYTVAFPLLKQYGLQAILFTIPGRVAEDGSASPFVTWPQLREMHASGLFDVQSHTRTHAMIFSDAQVVDFVSPAFAREPLLNRPVEADGLGTPLYMRRSRMSDARRFHADERIAQRCRAHVQRNGGVDFFRGPNWRRELMAHVADANGDFESDGQRASLIRAELADGRALLNENLQTTDVKHVALPWGIAGEIARKAVEATGHQLAFAERPWRKRTVRAGDDRFQLMRLNGKFLTCLPGRGRTWFFTTVR
jgi:polysaccharide deacetylase